MNRMTLALTALTSLTLAPIAAAEGASLDVTVTGVSKPGGSIRIGLYHGEEAYATGAALADAVVEVSGDTVTTTFTGLEPGAYGVKLFHDVDDDGELDANAFGMPSEPYAFSNNARGRFGPAKWKDAAFEVGPGGAEQSITLK